MSYIRSVEGSKCSCEDYTNEHTIPLHRMLHWLSISSRIAYKIDSICHTSLTTAYPKYLSELLTVYTPARPLCSSSDPNILNIVTKRIKSYSQRTFAYQGPSNWNRVPGEVRRTEDMFAFRRKLKTSSSISRTKISKTVFFVFQLFNVILLCMFVSLSL